MDFLCKTLKIIKNKPGLYIGKVSFELLTYYIFGYCERQEEICGRMNTIIEFKPEFQNFVQAYYGVTETELNWNDIIAENAENDRVAFDKFYELLDLYLIGKGYAEGLCW